MQDRPQILPKPSPIKLDAFLLCLMGILAACGLIYEYLLTHFSGLILGRLEHTLYIMIGLMIVCMGVGAYLARFIKDPFSGFIKLELSVAFLGGFLLIFIALSVGFSHVLGQMIGEAFGMPQALSPQGGWIDNLKKFSTYTPYISGGLIGVLIGMEIPLIGQVREFIYQSKVKHNLGTLYGADYVGAGIGAFIWVSFLLQLNMAQVGAYIAITNLICGFMFLLFFKKQIKAFYRFVFLHLLLAVLCVGVIYFGPSWLNNAEDMLYKDPVVYRTDTKYQHLTISERNDKILQFFINGHLQFSTLDEHIYHESLVHPAMSAATQKDNVLLIGGGDGLAIREILKWHPKHVTLLDLDRELVELFAGKSTHPISQTLNQLNQNALNHPSVDWLFHDAFIAIDELYQAGKTFDVVIIDLPDPSHPDLNRLYTVHFYKRLKRLLTHQGRLVIQSTSPFFAKNAFISIANTLKTAGLTQVQQYRVSVPSFGEWGFTLALGNSTGFWDLIDQVPTKWLTTEMFKATMVFPKNYYANASDIEPNRLGTHRLYQYHQDAWRKFQ